MPEQFTGPDCCSPQFHLLFSTGLEKFLIIDALSQFGCIFQHAIVPQNLGQFIISKGGELIKISKSAPTRTTKCTIKIGNANLSAFEKPNVAGMKDCNIAK